ncbi:Ubiquitin-2 like Rad60 SUMO-like family protein [Brugia pahangi]
MMTQKEEETTGDDEDDFFGNPLKHLMSKVIAAKKDGSVTGTAINDVRKEDSIKKDTSKKKENTLDDLIDDDDDLLTLKGKRKVREDCALLKVEQEIKQLENFSNISAFHSSGLSPLMGSSMKNDIKRQKKVMDDSNSNSLGSPFIIDGGTLEADDNIFAKEKVFVVEPHCSIEIGDLESCDTYIKRWKMSETFTDIVKLYASNWSCSPENVVLSLRNGKRVFAEDTPSSVAFSEKDVNYLSVYKNNQSGSINVKWLLPEQNKPVITAVPKDTPFMIVKRDFAVDNGLDEEKLTLIFDGKRISPQETADTLGIEDGDCIDVYMK